MTNAEQFISLPPRFEQHPKTWRWLCSVCRREFGTDEDKTPERCQNPTCDAATQLQLQQTRIAEILARAEEQTAFQRDTMNRLDQIERHIDAIVREAKKAAESRRIFPE